MSASDVTVMVTRGNHHVLVRSVMIAFQDLYRVLDFVGQGTFGAVYKVSNLRDGDYFALKILKSEFVPDNDARIRFEREFELLARLRHKNIVRVHDSGTKSGFSYFTMDWVEGGSLSSVLRQTERFDSSEVRIVLSQLLSALGHLWDNEIVHRDLKPDNILIDDSRKVYLVADFGLAKFGAHLEHRPAYWAGTIPYMAPEQFCHAGDVDIRADLYSLGIVGIQLLTGSLPEFVLSSDDPVAARYSVDFDGLSNQLRQFAPSCSLPTVLCKAIMPDPNARWANPVEMKQGLWT
ncbi:MAG: serine/threonine protein kinase [Ignavibacteriae bacterium]|nr:serine/threonine protein kinase [Ignavibacteriota bacterium]